MNKTKLSVCKALAALAVLITSSATAAENFWDFTGNFNGWQNLNYDNDTVARGNAASGSAQANMRTSYVFTRDNNKVAISARKISFNVNEGGRIRTFNEYALGTCTGRVRIAGNDSKNAWGGLWFWTEKRGADNWEIDLMETTPSGNQNNVYVSDDQSRPGAKHQNANSLGWRNVWRNYKVFFNANDPKTFFDNQGTLHTANQGTKPGRKVKISLQNRPFSFTVHHGLGGANGKFFAELNCDFVRIVF